MAQHDATERGEPTPGNPVVVGRTDADISLDLHDLLALDRVANDANIAVHVNHGIVRLTGLVTTPARRADAERLARALPGVVDVVNELRVIAAGTAGQG